MSHTTTSAAERVFRRVTATDGCWEWTGAKDARGYGYVSNKSGSRLVHRVVYEALIGPIPDDLVLDHLCRNPSCCNPLHLEPVSQGVNVSRGNSPHAENAAKETCPAGHPYSAANTYRNPKTNHRLCRACGAHHHRKARKRKGTP